MAIRKTVFSGLALTVCIYAQTPTMIDYNTQIRNKPNLTTPTFASVTVTGALTAGSITTGALTFTGPLTVQSITAGWGNYNALYVGPTSSGSSGTGGYIQIPPTMYPNQSCMDTFGNVVNQPVVQPGLPAFGTNDAVMWVSTSPLSGTSPPSCLPSPFSQQQDYGLNVNEYVFSLVGFGTDRAAYNSIQSLSGGVSAVTMQASAYLLPGEYSGSLPPDPYQSTGVVSTTGTAVTWVSGVQFFSQMATPEFGYITINGVVYQVGTVISPTQLTLDSSAGNQTNVAYVFHGWAAGSLSYSFTSTCLSIYQAGSWGCFSGGSGSPGSPVTSVQFNSSGSLAGNQYFNFADSGTQSILRVGINGSSAVEGSTSGIEAPVFSSPNTLSSQPSVVVNSGAFQANGDGSVYAKSVNLSGGINTGASSGPVPGPWGISGSGVATVSSCSGCTTAVYCVGTGTNTITCPGVPTPGSYTVGMTVGLQAGGNNTGATTVNINSLGAKNILSGGIALTAGALTTGSVYTIYYDGTEFNLQSASVTSVTGTGILTASPSTGLVALNVAGTSGGVPYFSASNTWASSAALASNALVIGGGAGTAPFTSAANLTFGGSHGTNILYSLGGIITDGTFNSTVTGGTNGFQVNGGTAFITGAGLGNFQMLQAGFGAPLTVSLTGVLSTTGGVAVTSLAAFNSIQSTSGGLFGLTLGSTDYTAPGSYAAGSVATGPPNPWSGWGNGSISYYCGASCGAPTGGCLAVYNGSVWSCLSGGGGSVTWPTSASLVVSNGTNSPAGIAPVSNDCVVGGASWAAGACVLSFNGRVGAVTMIKADVTNVTQALGTGDTPTFSSVTGTNVFATSTFNCSATGTTSCVTQNAGSFSIWGNGTYNGQTLNLGSNNGTHATAGGGAIISNSGSVVSAVFWDSNGVCNLGSTIPGTFCASDARLKTNIRPLGGSGLDRVMALRPVAFDWKATSTASEGFIAQDVEKVIPMAVQLEKSSGTYLLNREALIPWMVKALQEQQAEIVELRSKLPKRKY